jgi:hypothetical protein
MSMYYSMILIPADASLRPAPARLVSFLGGLLEMGALGRAEKLLLANHARGRVTSVGRDPLTGERIEHRSPEVTLVDSLDALASALGGLTDFDVSVQGAGPAGVLPIRDVGSFDHGTWRPLDELIASGTTVEDYELNVECCQRSKLTSTSDLHEETETELTAPFFGQPCDPGDRTGLYSNPETIELIQVPNAGCSSFWIAFTFGKWLFPPFRENRIAFAEPRVVQLAETSFGTKFAEGCFWG